MGQKNALQKVPAVSLWTSWHPEKVILSPKEGLINDVTLRLFRNFLGDPQIATNVKFFSKPVVLSLQLSLRWRQISYVSNVC